MKINYHSINGQLTPAAEASLGVSDLAILRGYGLFDYFLVRKGQPLFFDDYMARFERSAQLMGLQPPFTREEIARQIFEVIRANGELELGIKLVLTGGYSSDGYAPATPNLLVLASPLPKHSPANYENGTKLMLHEYHRSIPSAKTINYLIGIHLLPQMREAGAEDVLFHFGGLVYETTRANFFIVKNDGTIVTAGSGILEGITRKKTLEVARRHYKVEERPLELTELAMAKEAFLTSTTKRAMPVVQVDGLTIGDGKPGEVTKHIFELLVGEEERYLSGRECQRWKDAN